jgi:hypothetical protein
MAADPIIYCLEQLTDYREFEKLCCALLASQAYYPQIDPIGGTDDGGRDAIVRNDESSGTIAFAFTVRKDWLTKLKSDSKRLNETQNKLDKLVFVCTSQLNAKEKDEAFGYIDGTYGWHLDLFDQARLRAFLVQPGCTLIESHPSIFTPCFFAPPATTKRYFAQQYLDQYASLFQTVASSTENLAVEINREMYKWIGWVVRNAKTVELTCYDATTLNALTSLHNALAKIYGVISDEHYISPSPDSWRMKFNNRERSDINVQAVLAAKKVEILPYLEEFRVALKDFAELSKDSPSAPASW